MDVPGATFANDYLLSWILWHLAQWPYGIHYVDVPATSGFLLNLYSASWNIWPGWPCRRSFNICYNHVETFGYFKFGILP